MAALVDVTSTRGSAAALRGAPDRIRQRIRAEFLEMPGLKLTLSQASRVFGLDARTLKRLLDELVFEGFLMRDTRGAFLRRTDRRPGIRESAMTAETSHDTQTRRRPHTQPASSAYVELDLQRELELLREEPEWKSGHNAKALVKHDTLRIVLGALNAHARIPEHRTEGRISVQTLRGRIVVRANGRTFDLPEGNLLVLDAGVAHDVEALEESAFLLTIAF